LLLNFTPNQKFVTPLEPTTKKKEAPPFVVIPVSVKPTVDMKHTQEPSLADEEKAPGRESYPIRLELCTTEYGQ
jgi:hypothetical protein